MVKQKAEKPLEEFAECCQSLANDAWGDDNQDMADHAAMDAFLQWVMDTKSAYSAMDKNPANADEALDYLKCVMHNRKALFGARTKTIQNVTFGEDDEGVEERHIRIMKQVTPAPPAKADDRIEKLEKSVALETTGAGSPTVSITFFTKTEDPSSVSSVQGSWTLYLGWHCRDQIKITISYSRD